MLLGLASLAAAAPASECTQTWNAGGVTDVVESADLNISKMDTEGFFTARDTLLRRLVCVNEPLSGTTVGAVHRVVATGMFLQKEESRIAPALAGLLSAAPGYQLPLALYPEGHPIRDLLSHAALLARDSSTRPLVALESGWLEVDGLALAAAPLGRASVIQQLDGQGAVVETRYVWPGDELGAWDGSLPVATVAAPEPRARGKARVPMIALTAASLVTTGVLYGVAFDARETFRDVNNGLTDDELVALRSSTNNLTIGWSAAGVASLGLGVGLAFAW
ncbi:MAG: hypothetical protein Q8P18_24230 [Pseudomonadota bacterium]|nr:hypothetical protein [Pseudomonadota bacterium]